MELCPALGVSIPVGKDSMSMRTTWRDAKSGEDKSVTAPVSLIVSAFAPVTDARRALTPQLRTDKGESELILIDLGAGRNRLGGSILAQVCSQLGNEAPDLDDPAMLRAFFAAIQKLNGGGKILAYHDRSDGGLFATLAEMAFAGRSGVTVYLDNPRDRHEAPGRGRPRAPTRRARRRPRGARAWPRSSTKSWARCCRCAAATAMR
jgi:phosphoribosylformylglycinamidine synthase